VAPPHAPSILRSDVHELRRHLAGRLDVCAPLLDGESRSWLRSALELAHPGHPWLADLQQL
jgi:hypothetical protein